jgi:hypothetical protein
MSAATVKANLCMTPSPWLQQHEWQAHGTCHWDTPEAYFKKARKVRKGLKVPDLAPGPNGTMTAGQIREAFLKGNRGMTREGLNVRVKDGRLTEVWVCMDLKFKLAACRGGNGAPDDCGGEGDAARRSFSSTPHPTAFGGHPLPQGEREAGDQPSMNASRSLLISVGLRRRHAVREARIGDQRTVLQQLDRLTSRGVDRHDLVVLAVQHQHRHVDRS